MDQIKNHHFFYGVDWDTIRLIDAPFVPHLRSITDTSYFPTDELDQAPESATGQDSKASTKDLAFLGFVIPQNNCVVDFIDNFFFGLQLHIQALQYINFLGIGLIVMDYS